MEDGILGFMIGSISGLIPGYYIAKMLLKTPIKEMINEKTSRRIQDLEFDNSFLEKKLSILMKDNVRIVKERNEFASDISKKLKGL